MMKHDIVCGLMWIAVAVVVAVGIKTTTSLVPIWALLIPAFVTTLWQTENDKEDKK